MTTSTSPSTAPQLRAARRLHPVARGMQDSVRCSERYSAELAEAKSMLAKLAGIVAAAGKDEASWCAIGSLAALNNDLREAVCDAEVRS